MDRFITTAALCLCAGVATGCNEHPLKPVEYTWHQTCGESLTIAAERPNVMLVLDRSGSMTADDERWDHDNRPETDPVTRWSSLHGVTSDLLGRFDDRMHFGAVLFPSQDAQSNWAEACPTADAADVEVGPQGAAQIVTMLPGANATTEGGTPTQAGFLNAIDHLNGLESEAPRAIVLVTDGAANCVGDDPLAYDGEVEEVVAQARLDGVLTYLVGIDIKQQEPADEQDDVEVRDPIEDMNAIARAGGAPKVGAEAFYNVFDEAALDSALAEIAAQVVCSVEVSEAPQDGAEMFVSVGGEPVAEVAACSDGDGWFYASATSIRLCAGACDAFVAHGDLTTAYDCSPEV